MGRIAVIGSMNMDLVVRAMRAPEPGETLAGSDLQVIPGGKGANQAIAASRTGVETIMVGCVGADTFGSTLINSIIQANIDTRGVRVIEGISTGTAIIIVEDSGENRIIIIPGANSQVSPHFVLDQWDAISKSDVILLQHEIPLTTVRTIIIKAHSEGIRIVLNPAPIYPIPVDILSMVDILVVNETEATELTSLDVTTNETAFKAADLLFHQGVKTVIITMGRSGAVLVDGQNQLYQPAIPVEAVDTTAAGDTFVGSFTACIVQGKTPKEALVYATSAASLCVTRFGAQPSIPTQQEVDLLLHNNV